MSRFGKYFLPLQVGIHPVFVFFFFPFWYVIFAFGKVILS